MAREFSIDNFLKMNPSVPSFSSKNTNFVVAGADPVYYLSTGEQEEQTAPLAAALDWTTVNGTVEGNIVHMVAGIGGIYTAYAVTDTTKVYGFTTSSIVDLGYPAGSSKSNTGGYLCIGGNSLYMTYSADTVVYKMTLPSGAWSSFGVIHTGTGVHNMEQFADHIAIFDGTTLGTIGNIVKLIDPTGPSILSTPQLNLGLGFGAIQMRNYNDKYLAIALGKVQAGTIVNGYPQNYIYLWDGAYNTFNYSVKVPGRFIDMKVVNSVLYVAVEVSNGKTCVYYLNGTKLSKLFTTQISTIAGTQDSSTPCVLFDFKNYLGVHIATTTNLANNLTHPIVVYGKDDIGDIEFVHTTGKRFDQFVVDYNGVLFGNVYIPNGTSQLVYLPTTGSSYQQLSYTSQWIKLRNAQGIDIWYDSPPQSGTDAINVTLYGKGQDIITGTVTTVLDPITPSNYLNQNRTRLDLKGFAGDQARIVLTTVNSTWRPIIRKIVLITQ